MLPGIVARGVRQRASQMNDRQPVFGDERGRQNPAYEPSDRKGRAFGAVFAL